MAAWVPDDPHGVSLRPACDISDGRVSGVAGTIPRVAQAGLGAVATLRAFASWAALVLDLS